MLTATATLPPPRYSQNSQPSPQPPPFSYIARVLSLKSRSEWKEITFSYLTCRLTRGSMGTMHHLRPTPSRVIGVPYLSSGTGIPDIPPRPRHNIIGTVLCSSIPATIRAQKKVCDQIRHNENGKAATQKRINLDTLVQPSRVRTTLRCRLHQNQWTFGGSCSSLREAFRHKASLRISLR